MPTDKLEIEISKFAKGEGYSFSSEDDGKKRVYIIYSFELRKKLQAMVSPFGELAKGNIQYKGENNQGDRILYHQNTDSDQLTLISKEIINGYLFKDKLCSLWEEVIETNELDYEKLEPICPFWTKKCSDSSTSSVGCLSRWEWSLKR